MMRAVGRRLIFFFSSRRRHTRFDCDWSSDVCSSDLRKCSPKKQITARRSSWKARRDGGRLRGADGNSAVGVVDRKSVVEGKSVDLGGRRIIKKKKRSIVSWRCETTLGEGVMVGFCGT